MADAHRPPFPSICQVLVTPLRHLHALALQLALVQLEQLVLLICLCRLLRLGLLGVCVVVVVVVPCFHHRVRLWQAQAVAA